MRDAQHLIRLRKLLEFQADCFADTPSNARVDLIENDCARKLWSVRNGLQHKHQTRCFATWGDSRQRFYFFAHVGRKVKLRVIDAFLARGFNFIWHLHLKPSLVQRDFLDSFFNSFFKLFRRPHTLLVQFPRTIEITIAGRGNFTAQLLFALVRCFDLSQTIFRTREVIERSFNRSTILAFEPRQFSEAIFDLG